jgi:transposase
MGYLFLPMKQTDTVVLEHYKRILTLPDPWQVASVDTDMDAKSITLSVIYPMGTLAHCPECGTLCSIKDRRRKKWRHLAQMSFATYIECDVPRTDCAEHDVHQIQTPWAEPHGRFTLDFETFAIQLILACQNLTAVGDLLGISWNGIQAIQRRGVERGLLRRKREIISHLGIDEKSFLSRHRYATILSDLKGARILEVTQGRDEAAAQAALDVLDMKQRSNVEAVAADMWVPYRNAVKAQLPNAVLVHDRFHVMGYLTKALDKVRKKEHWELKGGGNNSLTGTKYLWLTSRENWSLEQKREYRELKDQNLKVGRAFAMKEQFRRFWSFTYAKAAEGFYKRWYFWATHSRLKPMIEAARTIERHYTNISHFFQHRITNAVAEGLNSKIQLIKAGARGFRNFANFRIAILFHCGGLKLRPHE